MVRRARLEARARRGLHYATDGRDTLLNTPDGWEVEQPWLWWDGPAGSGGTGGPWGNPLPNDPTRNGVGRLLPAMSRCRSLIADQLAGVPWKVYKGNVAGYEPPMIQPPPDWVTDPQGLREDGRVQSTLMDVRLSAQEFWSSFIISAIELGEGIIYVPVRGTNGQPVPPLHLIHPHDLEIEDGGYSVRGTKLEPHDLIVVRNYVPPGSKRGVGVWQQFAADLGFGDSLRSFGAGMLGRGIPAGYLKVNAPDVSQEEASALQRRWTEIHGGRDRRIAVLNAVTEFHPLQFDPQALQLAELLRLSAWQVALIYGVPPHKLGISMGTSQTYANIESANIEFVQESLLPWARRIESAMDAEFPRGTGLKLELDGLRRADTKTRYEAHAIALDKGFLTIDEVRELEDRQPLPPPAAPLRLVEPPPERIAE